MLKVAITGKPGSGKSLICKMLSDYIDTYIIYTDLINRDVLFEHENEVLNLLKLDYFSMKAIREQVFGNPDKLTILENFTKPYILKRLNYIWSLRSFEVEGKIICFTEVPLLYEAGWDKYFDKIVVVYCDEEERELRLHYRGWTKNMIEILSSRFTSVDLAKPDYKIDTLCSLVELRNKVNKLYYCLEEVRKRR